MSYSEDFRRAYGALDQDDRHRIAGLVYRLDGRSRPEAPADGEGSEAIRVLETRDGAAVR